ncbi:hypothetical protein STANM309S_04195 [Streptomyces tanashiensis]
MTNGGRQTAFLTRIAASKPHNVQVEAGADRWWGGEREGEGAARAQGGVDLGEQGALVGREEVAEGAEADREVEGRGEGEGQGVGADQVGGRVGVPGPGQHARTEVDARDAARADGAEDAEAGAGAAADVEAGVERAEGLQGAGDRGWRRSEVRKGVASNLLASRS